MDGPPVGIYSPKYEVVLSQKSKAYVKFDQSPARSPSVKPGLAIQHAHHLKNDDSKRSLSQNPHTVPSSNELE